MILISVAHSSLAQGAENKTYQLTEYPLSKIASMACSEFLMANFIDNDVLDVGSMSQKEYLSKKINYINKTKPELALEIHFNGGSATATRSEIYYFGHDERTHRVSQLILNNFKNEFEPHGWGHVELKALPRPPGEENRYNFVLKSKFPAIIIEPIFITNDKQAEWLLAEENVQLVGKMVAKGIIQWRQENQNLLLN